MVLYFPRAYVLKRNSKLQRLVDYFARLWGFGRVHGEWMWEPESAFVGTGSIEDDAERLRVSTVISFSSDHIKVNTGILVKTINKLILINSYLIIGK